MDDSGPLAETLTLKGGDRYAEVREAAAAHAAEHGCGLSEMGLLQGRALAVLVRATHSSYVLELGSGLGYSGLNIMSSFGATGRLDTIEPDPVHARITEGNLDRYSFGDRSRVHTASAAQVIPALSGPYDLIVLNNGWKDAPKLYDDLLRLVRTGGSILALDPHEHAQQPGADAQSAIAFLSRLAEDDRLAVSFGVHLEHIIATRIR